MGYFGRLLGASGGGGTPGGLYPYSLTLTNPGAETGDLTGWTDSAGAFSVSTESPTHGGTYLFLGNTTTAGGLSQTVTLPSEVLTDVDAGALRAMGHVFARSASLGADAGYVQIEALDGSSSVLATVRSPSRDLGGTSFVELMASAPLPTGTRSLRLTLYESAIDAVRRYDDAAITLYQDYALTVTNPGFETGVLTPWVQESGSGAAVGTNHGGYAAHGGTYQLRVGASSFAIVSQDVSVPSDYHADIDAGDAIVCLTGWQNGWSGDGDTGWLSLAFYDGSAVEIAGSAATGEAFNGGGTWVEYGVTARVPANTRTIRVRLNGDRSSGTNLDAYFDDIALHVGAS